MKYFLMIGAWTAGVSNGLLVFIRFIVVFLILYFLAIIIYWFNRTKTIPSLRVVWRIMVQLAKWFPKILVHRVKMVPARIRKNKVDAYPSLSVHHSGKMIHSNKTKNPRAKKRMSRGKK